MTHVPPHAKNGAPRLTEEQLRALLAQFPDWRRDGDWIERKVEVRDFRAALRLVNLAGEAAERENHHPDLSITGWNKVTFRLSTHDAGGLTDNDFVLAREIDVLVAVG
jgi:4a-hydroxytetrahydrobiopterin dehydratase